jgi:hypothetical protein
MIIKKKRVLLLNWVMLDIGGIVTWSHQIIKGFNKLGWQADHYYCTRTGRFGCSETDFVPIGKKFKRGEKIPSKSLGFSSFEDIEYFNKIQDDYDFIIFVHPSPHPTKGNLSANGMENWKQLYFNAKIPVIVVFHDKKWRKTNSWFSEVVNNIDVVLAAQHNFIESVEDFASMRDLNLNPIVTDWLFFPLDTDKCGLDFQDFPREEKLCMLPQWIKWKNHRAILDVGDKIKIPIHFYNGGMEYHKIVWTPRCNKSIKVDWVEECYVNKESIHEYHGFISYEEVKKVYMQSVGSIDLTIRTYQNYTHHECSLYGCCLLCTEDCRIGPYNHIHDKEFWPVDIYNVEKSINDFISLPQSCKDEMRSLALIRTRENFECSKIASKIISIVETLNF